MEDLAIKQGKYSLALLDHVIATAYSQLSLVGDSSVKEYLLEKKHWTLDKFNKMFSRRERNILEKNITTDGELQYKLFQFVCGLHTKRKLWDIHRDTLESYLGRCYKKRKEILRGLQNSPEEVNRICSSVKELLLETLTKLEERTERDMSVVKDRVMTDSSPESLTNWELYTPLLLRTVTALNKIAFTCYNVSNISLRELCYETLNLKTESFSRVGREQIQSNESVDNLELTTIHTILLKLIPKGDPTLAKLKSLMIMKNHVLRRYAQSGQLRGKASNVFQTALSVLLNLGVKNKQSLVDMVVQMGEQLFPKTSSLPPSSIPSLPISPTPPSRSTPSLLASSVRFTSPSTLPSLPPSSTPSTNSTSTSTTPLLLTSTKPPTTSTPPTSPSPTSFTGLHASSTTSSSRFTSADVNVVRVFKALCPGGSAALVFAKTFKELSPVPLNGVIDYCKDILKYSEKKLKTFRDDEVSLMHNMATKLTELDLTFLYKLVGHVCDLAKQNEWSMQPCDTLEHNMYLVKSARNFLAHEASHYTDNDLKQLLLVDLPQWLETVLCKVQERCNTKLGLAIDLSQMAVDIKDDLKHLYSDPLPETDINTYHQKILAFRKTLADKVLARSISENKLRFKNDRLRVVHPFSWFYHLSHTCWDISELFTELEVINSVESSQVNSRVSTYKLLSLITSLTNILVVQGVGGAGKTSLCKFIIQCWRNPSGKMDGLVKVDLLIFIQCRYIYSDTLLSFLTQEELKETFKDVADEDVLRSLYDARLLFIVDGYDEAGPRARRLVEEALCKFPSSAFIITTRPEFKVDVEKLIFDSIGSQKMQFVRIIGFEGTTRQEYVNNLFRTLGRDPAPFLEHLKTLDRYMGTFTLLTITIASMAAMWIDGTKMSSDAVSITQIYRQNVKFFLKKTSERQRKKQTHIDNGISLATFLNSLGRFFSTSQSGRQHVRPTEAYHVNDIKMKLEKWVKTLSEIAWNNLKLNRISLSDEDEVLLRCKSDEYGLDPTDALSCLLQCETMTTQTGSHESWEFIHKTIQEFLAADHLCREIAEQNKLKNLFQLSRNLKQIEKKIKEHYQVLLFVAGLLVEKKIMTMDRAKELLDLVCTPSPWAFDYITSLTRECILSPDFRCVLKVKFQDSYLPKYLEGFDPESLHCVLQNTALLVSAELTIIRITSSDTGKMKPLLDLVTTRSCQLHVIVPADNPESINTTIQDLQGHHPDGAKIIFSCTTSDSFPVLLQHWPWPKPLYVKFHSTVFPLLWLEFVACMMVSRLKSPRKITYNGKTKANEDVVLKLTDAIKVPFETNRSSSEEFITICDVHRKSFPQPLKKRKGRKGKCHSNSKSS